MKVYLTQHALAVDASVDAQRPLSNQGREDTTRTAGFLSLFEKPKPQRIFHSHKLRAEQTAAMFAEAWGGIACEQAEYLSPNANPAIWQEKLLLMAQAEEDVMLIGHLPHLQRLAGLLLCNDTERQAVHMRNSAVLCLSFEQQQWQVEWYLHPSLFYASD